jgi:hypothetical protein
VVRNELFPGTEDRAILPGRTAGELPEDAALSGLMAIRRLGLSAAIPALGIPDDAEVELRVLAHKPGLRAALLATTRDQRHIIKIVDGDPSDEAALHRAFADAALAGDSGDRVPRLVHVDPNLGILVMGCLEGSEAAHLLRNGRAERAGELAARWLHRVVTLPFVIGKPIHAYKLLKRASKWVIALGRAEPGLGKAAAAVAGALMRSPPPTRTARLVHGTFHDRNVLDLGDGVGVIDWTRYRQGPMEFDAGTFLASISRAGLDERRAPDAAAAERAFLGGISGLVHEPSVAWFRGTALLALADRVLSKKKGDWLARAHALVSLALTFASLIECWL